MITKLTSEQGSKIPTYIKKWIDIASQPMDEKKADQSMRSLYKVMGEEYNGIIIGDSPITTSMLFLILKDLSKNESSLESSLDSSLESSLDSSLESSLDSSLESSLDLSLYSSLESSLYSSLYSSLGSSLSSSLYSSLSSSLKDGEWYQSYFWLVWCGWYDYGKYIGVKYDEKKYNLFIDYNINHHFVIPRKKICFTSRKPVISWKNGILHNDTDKAIKYRDGWGIYVLNGVTVPEYLVETKASELDVEFFKKEKNSDVKAEFIRKYGIDRMAGMGKKIDSWEKYKSNQWWVKSEYELINMASIFESIEFAPHVKCKNQTTGIYHLEAVAPECDTLEKAMNFRHNNRVNLNTLDIK